MTDRLTQLAVEVWTSRPAVLRTTQAAIEVWVTRPAVVRTTQATLEVWLTRPAVVRTTQAALEVFTVEVIPTAVTQVALESFILRPLGPQVTQLLVELFCQPGQRGRLIRRLRRASLRATDYARVYYQRFELDLERGQGAETKAGMLPQVMLRLSRDGGFTWSEPMLLPAGRLGDYLVRARADRLGSGRDVVFEVTVSDPIAWSLVQAWLEIDVGIH